MHNSHCLSDNVPLQSSHCNSAYLHATICLQDGDYEEIQTDEYEIPIASPTIMPP